MIDADIECDGEVSQVPHWPVDVDHSGYADDDGRITIIFQIEFAGLCGSMRCIWVDKPYPFRRLGSC